MSLVGERETHTPRRVAAFFGGAPGCDRPGDRTSRPGNADVETERPRRRLVRRGRGDKTLHELGRSIRR